MKIYKRIKHIRVEKHNYYSDFSLQYIDLRIEFFLKKIITFSQRDEQ